MCVSVTLLFPCETKDTQSTYKRVGTCVCVRWEPIWNGTFCSSWLHTSSVHLSALRRSPSLCSHGSHQSPHPCIVWKLGEKRHFSAILPTNPAAHLFLVRPHSRPFTRLFVPGPQWSQGMVIYLNLFKWIWVACTRGEISQPSRSANTKAVPPHRPPIRPHRQLILTTGGQVYLHFRGKQEEDKR